MMQIVHDRDRVNVIALAALEAAMVEPFGVELDTSQRHPRLALWTAPRLDCHQWRRRPGGQYFWHVTHPRNWWQHNLIAHKTQIDGTTISELLCLLYSQKSIPNIAH